MTQFRTLLAAALLSLLCAGCGYRGPLYLPEDESPPAATADEADAEREQASDA